MRACDAAFVMDPILAAGRLPRLAELAMRDAIVQALGRGRLTPRALVDEALVRFERAVARRIGGTIRPALLFTERDRIVRELRCFVDGRLCARLSALERRAFVALGASAAPFDAVVRSRRGTYGVVFRRLPSDGRRLEVLRRARAALQKTRTPLDGVLLYDFVRARATLVLDHPGAYRVDGYLRAS